MIVSRHAARSRSIQYGAIGTQQLGRAAQEIKGHLDSATDARNDLGMETSLTHFRVFCG